MREDGSLRTRAVRLDAHKLTKRKRPAKAIENRAREGGKTFKPTAALHVRGQITKVCGLGNIRYTVAERIARLNTNGGALTPALKSTTPNISIVRDANTIVYNCSAWQVQWLELHQ